MVHLLKCKKVLLQGIIFQNSPAWNIHPELCEDLIMDGVDVRNPSYAQNGDGLDLESCKNCLIVNTTFDVGDDGICLKSGKDEAGRKRGVATENVIIDGCTVYASHGGFVIGSEFSGGMEKIIVKDCVFDGTDIGLRFKSAPGRGGWCEDILCQDIVMKDIREQAILFEAGYADRAVGRSATDSDNKEAYFPDWANFTFRNLTSVNAKAVLYANGMKGFPVHDIKFENCNFYGARAGIELDYAENFTFTNCSITPAMTNSVHHAKNILFNGTPLE